MLEVTLIPYHDKNILSQLIQLYRYDSSEFDGHALNEHGLYMYKYLDHQWTDEYRRPCLFRINGEIAGFALVMLDVPRKLVKLSEAERTNVIGDYFIMRKFRGQGYGRQAAFELFDRFPGTWELRQTKSNLPANYFWNQVLEAYTGGSYEQQMLEDERWHGPVQVFRSRTLEPN
ncbi:putative acetyltransferase [Paenibacillus cellulosilyticus]|uniref:Putative acetyltransferase n=1 Tax=Paenibacillus cellulosilyticus TaxID=375489 RepID=A0A2V2YMT0_9BACL|nr:GNAT family N-acetyltransferase [Paenibacillus cellulosilyticus]PWV94533.1 putative acetyltransferase [Paenibacillus cellulosilyticus]QKS45037.1 GNAT family N-acetyltransferase [Paenibacillus cellulosilyticus]